MIIAYLKFFSRTHLSIIVFLCATLLISPSTFCATHTVNNNTPFQLIIKFNLIEPPDEQDGVKPFGRIVVDLGDRCVQSIVAQLDFNEYDQTALTKQFALSNIVALADMSAIGYLQGPCGPITQGPSSPPVDTGKGALKNMVYNIQLVPVETADENITKIYEPFELMTLVNTQQIYKFFIDIK